MAYYKCSKIIGMRRKELGYSRDAFDVDGPSGMTVYRMESGLHRNRESTYRTLTKCMGVEESLGQGLLHTLEADHLNQINELIRKMQEKQYEEAEAIFWKLEKQIDTQKPRNKQYLKSVKAELAYRRGQLCEDEYEKELKDALAYTVLSFKGKGIQNWPLYDAELALVLKMNNILKRQKKYDEQLELMQNLREVLQEEYINEELRIRYQIISVLALADVYGNMGKYREAISYGREGIKLSLENREYRNLSVAYYELHWNLWKLKEKETLSSEEETECFQSLLKAYYFAKAIGENKPLYGNKLKERYPNQVWSVTSSLISSSLNTEIP